MNVSRHFAFALFATLGFNTILMLVFAFKYLHVVNQPQPGCLHPSAVPTHLENARSQKAVDVWT